MLALRKNLFATWN